ncbi:hypothetical protein MASR1M59_25120 [Melaminivora sp.]
MDGGVDAFGILAQVHCPTGASRAYPLVLYHLGAQYGQLQHLACVEHFVLYQDSVTVCAPRRTVVMLYLIGLGALAQSTALVTALTTVGALAWLAQ